MEQTQKLNYGEDLGPGLLDASSKIIKASLNSIRYPQEYKNMKEFLRSGICTKQTQRQKNKNA
jgi:hypothetical protein